LPFPVVAVAVVVVAASSKEGGMDWAIMFPGVAGVVMLLEGMKSVSENKNISHSAKNILKYCSIYYHSVEFECLIWTS